MGSTSLPLPYFCRQVTGGKRIYDVDAIEQSSFSLVGAQGTFEVSLGVSSHGGVEATIEYLPTRSRSTRYYFVQVCRSSDGTAWAHGANNVLTKSVDVYPRTDPASGYRVDNRYGYPFFSQQEAAHSPDFSDLKVVGCSVGDKATPARLNDGAGGLSTAVRLKEIDTALFFRFEAIASLMDLGTKNILDSVEWVFDVLFRSPHSMQKSVFLVYPPVLMRTLLTSKDVTVREAANARFIARNACFSFWNEKFVPNQKGRVPVPGTPVNWAYDGSNLG
jgi:hypothetical protein